MGTSELCTHACTRGTGESPCIHALLYCLCSSPERSFYALGPFPQFMPVPFKPEADATETTHGVWLFLVPKDGIMGFAT